MAKISEEDIVSYFFDALDCKRYEEVDRWIRAHFEDDEFEDIAGEFWKLGPVAEVSESARKAALKNFYRRLGRNRRSRFLRMSLAAASAAIFLLGFYLIYSLPSDSNVEWKELYTENTTRDSLTLSDGTRIILNSGSRVIYPSAFHGGIREIFASGEVYLQVAKDNHRQFSVKAGPATVCVLGTEFNLKTSDDLSKVDVELYEGKIMMKVGDNESVYLSPGEKAVYENGAVSILKSGTAGMSRPVWLDGAYDSGYKSLSGITADFEKIYGIKIIIADESLASRKYRISLAPGMRLDDVLETLDYDKTISISRYDNLIILNTR